MVTLSTPAIKKMHSRPDGGFSVKMLTDVAVGDLPVQSNIIRAGYGGGGSVAMVVAMTGTAKPTGISCTLQGRMDDTCPWVDIMESTDTLLASSTMDVLRTKGALSAPNQPTQHMVWPEMRVSFDTQAGGGTAPVWDVWVGVSPGS